MARPRTAPGRAGHGALLLLSLLLLLLLLLPALAAAADAPAANATANATENQAARNSSPFFTAPRCPTWPRASTSTRDREGRLWGFAYGQSCAYKTADKGEPQELDVWETVFACGDDPTSSSAVADPLGRLWGWDAQRLRSCAYKEVPGGRPRFFDGYQPASWLKTPACPSAKRGAAAVFDGGSFASDLAVTDSAFKTWSLGEYSDAPRLCAEKDDRQAPLPPRPSEYRRLSFLDAPACSDLPGVEGVPSPDNARPDRDGLLWGWVAERPCAFKSVKRSADTGRVEAVTPLYYGRFEGPRQVGGGRGGRE